jgi:pyridoxamine 5'-phosphate oxidase family protein
VTAFSESELAYLGERRLARLATVGQDGTPHVVPVGMWSHNAELDTIDVSGRDFANSKKFRDVRRSGRAALVVDDTSAFHATQASDTKGWGEGPSATAAAPSPR